MAKTLRVRTRAGWTTKPVEDTDANRLLAEEVDDNFLAMEDENLAPSGDTIINIRETVQAVSDGSVNADLGAIVNMTLSANAVLDVTNLSSGQYVALHISGGDLYSMDWTTNHTITWHGGVPVLKAVHTVLLEQVGTTLYGYDVGGAV